MRIASVGPNILAILACLAIAGCGLTVPDVQDFYEDPSKEAITEVNLVEHIKCELQQAVQEQFYEEFHNRANFHNSIYWLRYWGAQVSLKIIVDEKSNISPGLNLNKIMPNDVAVFPRGGNVTTAQSFSLGLGGSLASDATRTESVGFYYGFAELLGRNWTAEKPDRSLCKPNGTVLIEGDLKIADFMRHKMLLALEAGVLSDKPAPAPKPAAGAAAPLSPSASALPAHKPTGPFNLFTYEVSFVVTATGSVTPTWKLVAVTGNPTGPFVGATRMRTNDLTITMGPSTLNDGTGQIEPSESARDAHLAALIGQSVASAIQSQQH